MRDLTRTINHIERAVTRGRRAFAGAREAIRPGKIAHCMAYTRN